MKLKDYRTKNKLSCSELARKIGIQNINPATNVWRWENGQRIPRKEEMKKRGIKSPDKADALALTMASSAASFSGSASYLGYNFKKPLKSRIFRVG